MRREDGVADLGAADQIRRSVEAAAADDLVSLLVTLRPHQPRHPVTSIRRLAHAIELNREEAGQVAEGRKLGWQPRSDDFFGGGAIALDEVRDCSGLSGHQLEARGPEGGHSSVLL